MPVLVRWRSPDGVVTLRAESTTTSSALPHHLMIVGVAGVSDPDHPDLVVHTLTVRRSDVLFCATGVVMETADQTDETVSDKVKPSDG
jgi:hypothetical protein